MLDNGLEITIRYRDKPIVLGVQRAFTLQEIKQYGTQGLVEIAAKHMYDEILQELKYVKVRL